MKEWIGECEQEKGERERERERGDPFAFPVPLSQPFPHPPLLFLPLPSFRPMGRRRPFVRPATKIDDRREEGRACTAFK